MTASWRDLRSWELSRPRGSPSAPRELRPRSELDRLEDFEPDLKPPEDREPPDARPGSEDPRLADDRGFFAPLGAARLDPWGRG